MIFSKEDILRDLEENIYCRIKTSPLEGVGVFAIRHIPQGTRIFSRLGEGDTWIRIPEKDILDNDRIHNEVKKMVIDFYSRLEGYIIVPNRGLNEIDCSFFMNHSEEPNVASQEGDFFTAARDIAAEEELLIDYRTFSAL